MHRIATGGRRYRNERSGFLLITGLLVITGLLTLTSVGLTRSMTELNGANVFVATNQALQLADAAVDQAISEYRTGGANGVVDLLLAPAQLASGGPSAHDEWYDASTDPRCPAGNTCYARSLQNTTALTFVIGPTTSTPKILGMGSSGVATERVGVVGDRRPPGFGYAFFGGNYLKIGSYGSGLVTTDSYDSTGSVPYGGGNIHSNGDIGTNDTSIIAQDPEVDLQLQSTTRVNGNVHITPWVDKSNSIPPGEISIIAGALCNGVACTKNNFVTNPMLDLLPIEVPSNLKALSCASPKTVGSFSNPTEQLDILTDACYESLTIRYQGKVVLHPGVRLYLKGNTGAPDANTSYILNISGPDYHSAAGALIATQNNEVYGERGVFWVRSQNGINLDTVNYPTSTPRDLIIRVVGNNSDAISGTKNGLEQQAPFQGALYIEHGWLYIKGDYYCDAASPPNCGYTPAENFGAVVAGDYLNPATHGSNPSTFHYDESLRGISINGGTKYFRILSWRKGLQEGEMP